MEFTEEKKKEVEKMIVDTAIDALGAGVITEDELQPIAGFVLSRIDSIKTEEELVTFLTELSEKWKFFLPVERFLEAEVKEEQEKKTVTYAEDLIKSGDINKALNVLKTADKGGM